MLTLPTPIKIQEARATAGHTQQQAAETIGITGKSAWRTWNRWEAGPDAPSGRAMQPGLFKLYLLMTGQHPEFVLTPRQQHTRPSPLRIPPPG
jgi:DNA-binding XRE family transcriptional regulator